MFPCGPDGCDGYPNCGCHKLIEEGWTMSGPKFDAVPGMITKINKLKEEIAAKRDELRDVKDELEQLVEDCDEAVDSMELAAEALSRLL